MNRVRSLPDAFARVIVADGRRVKGMVQVEIPVNHVDEMNHQVGQDAVAEIPKPAPVAKAIFVERLLGRVAQKCLPVHFLGIDALGPFAGAIGVAVPGQMNFVDISQLAGAHDFSGLLELRHAALLRADLHDALMLVLRIDDRFSFGQIVRQRFFDVHVLARGAGVDRHGHVPVIRRGDEHGVDVLAA